MDQEEYVRKCSNMKCQRVQVDESFVPALQDEVMEVEHSLTERGNDHVSVNGSLDSHTTLNGKDDLGLEVLDGILDDVEIDDLEVTGVFSGACEEYFLDFEFANNSEILGSGLSDGSLLQNSSSESHSSGLSGSSVVGGVSVPIAQSECKNDSLDGTVAYESQDAFRNNPSQPSNGDCMYNISLDIEHLRELKNDHSFAGGILSFENEKGSDEKCQPAALREKRFRKPTHRYIEEISNLRSKDKGPTAATENKHLSLSSCNELNVRLKALRKIRGEQCNNGNRDVTLSELKVRKGRPKKEKLEYDKEPFCSEFEDEYLTPKRIRKKDRRKHQRMWTLSEVVKLVDGISEYGVGRWTDIKRFFFSSSSYRTPIDLRDKWRNLLRASSAQKSNKKEVNFLLYFLETFLFIDFSYITDPRLPACEKKRRREKEAEQNNGLALCPLPFNVVHRVRELAKIHPYPRVRGSKKSRVSHVGPPAVASRSKGSPVISLSKRNLRRKKCT